MPLDKILVERVDACQTAKPGLFSYLVTGETVDERPRHYQVQTLSAWKASVCEASIAAKRAVWIGSRDTRYGLDLVTVNLDES